MSIPRTVQATTTVLAFAAMMACAEATDPVGPTLETVTAEAPAGHHVQGSGHVDTAAGLREFTFHAIERPSGDVTGSFKVVLPNGLFFEADVSCLTVEGDTGWVGGVIRATNAAGVIIGSTSMFWVRDDGEGAWAQDVVSVAGFNRAEGVDLAFCADKPLELGAMDVTGGNVQVR